MTPNVDPHHTTARYKKPQAARTGSPVAQGQAKTAEALVLGDAKTVKRAVFQTQPSFMLRLAAVPYGAFH
jgi:hypothetical protein